MEKKILLATHHGHNDLPKAVMNIVDDINEVADVELTESDLKLGTFIVGRVKVGNHWMKKADFLELQVASRPHPQKFQVCEINKVAKTIKLISVLPGARPFIVPFDKFI